MYSKKYSQMARSKNNPDGVIYYETGKGRLGRLAGLFFFSFRACGETRRVVGRRHFSLGHSGLGLQWGRIAESGVTVIFIFIFTSKKAKQSKAFI